LLPAKRGSEYVDWLRTFRGGEISVNDDGGGSPQNVSLFGNKSCSPVSNTPAFVNAQRQRKKVEALFAELKNQIGVRRLRLRRLKFVRDQFFSAAAAQNIKRLVRFLSQGPGSPLPATN